MKETNKNEVIIRSILEGGLSITEAATRFTVSRRWIFTLLARYKKDGLQGLTPQSRRPHTNPNQTPATTQEEILHLRDTLTQAGLDAGPESIWDHLDPIPDPASARSGAYSTTPEKSAPNPKNDRDPPGTVSRLQHLTKCGNQTSLTGTPPATLM